MTNHNQEVSLPSQLQVRFEEQFQPLYSHSNRSQEIGHVKIIAGYNKHDDSLVAQIRVTYDQQASAPREYRAQLWDPKTHCRILHIWMFRSATSPETVLYLSEICDAENGEPITEISTRQPVSVLDNCEQELPLVKLASPELHPTTEESLALLSQSLAETNRQNTPQAEPECQLGQAALDDYCGPIHSTR